MIISYIHLLVRIVIFIVLEIDRNTFWQTTARQIKSDIENVYE